jgi:peptide/nickel transport system substrate-binding protein
MTVIEEVVAADARTLLIRWRQPYAQADDLQAVDFPPLPRHLLEGAFTERDADAFVAHPFWLSDYVGLGPYRLRQVELGAFIEGVAFDGHALGRPKIAGIRFLGVPDPNVVVTNLLSDAAHVGTDGTITDEQQGAVLEREWQQRKAGVVLRSPLGVRYANLQLRPDYASTPALLDLRVRKAMAHATDRQVLVDAVTQGLTTTADTLVLRGVEYYPALDRAITKYPYDLGRAQQLMMEAGFAPGPEGFYTSPADGRFGFEISSPQGARNEAEITIMADGLRRAGMDASIRVIPRAQIAQPLVSSHYPGLFNGHITRAFEAPIPWLRASEIARAENRWRGRNYPGFNHPEFERLAAAWDGALDRSQRNQHVVDMLRVVSEEVPTIALYYSVNYLAHVAALRGPLITLSPDAISWNLHEWYWVA